MIANLSTTPTVAARAGILVAQDGVARSAGQLLAHKDMTIERLADLWPELAGLAPDIAEQISIESRYAAYLERQRGDIEALRRDEALRLPAELDYDRIGGLSNEVREKLDRARPVSLGAASRIPGITPAAVTALLRHVRQDRVRHAKRRDASAA